MTSFSKVSRIIRSLTPFEGFERLAIFPLRHLTRRDVVKGHGRLNLGGHRGHRSGERDAAPFLDRAGPREAPTSALPPARAACGKNPRHHRRRRNLERPAIPTSITTWTTRKSIAASCFTKPCATRPAASSGRSANLANSTGGQHEQVIRQIENGGLPQLDREMITPRDFSEAPELREIFRSGCDGRKTLRNAEPALCAFQSLERAGAGAEAFGVDAQALEHRHVEVAERPGHSRRTRGAGRA